MCTASQARRSGRAAIDMARIRGKAAGDPLVEQLLTAASTAMAEATQNHASEWLEPEGKLCVSKITPALRERYDALPSTSTPVERIHAIGRHVDGRCRGRQRSENRAGVSLAMYNDLGSWAVKKADEGVFSAALGVARAAERAARKKTLKQQRIEAGRAKQPGREVKLSSKRERRQKMKTENARLENMALATRYSRELKAMSVDELKDQLEGYKLQGKTGFVVTQENRGAYVLQVQTLMCEALGAGQKRPRRRRLGRRGAGCAAATGGA